MRKSQFVIGKTFVNKEIYGFLVKRTECRKSLGNQCKKDDITEIKTPSSPFGCSKQNCFLIKNALENANQFAFLELITSPKWFHCSRREIIHTLPNTNNFKPKQLKESCI